MGCQEKQVDKQLSPIAHRAAVPCVRGGRRETRLLARAEVVAHGSTVFTEENTTMMMAVVIVL